MERPFFSLAKTPRTKPILYKAADIEVQVFGMPEHGMATIWDADVLIWAASQIVAAENNGLTTSRFVRFTPYHLLRAIGRPTGNHQYRLLKAALARLQPYAPPPASAFQPPADPLRETLRRCQQLGEAAASDADCLAAWAQSRDRFLGRPSARATPQASEGR